MASKSVGAAMVVMGQSAQAPASNNEIRPGKSEIVIQV